MSLFEKVFDQSSIPKALVNFEGLFIRANPALCELLGLSFDELLKKSSNDITFEDDKDKNFQDLAKLQKGQIQSLSFEKRFLHKDGHPIWTLLNITSDIDNSFFIMEIQSIQEMKMIQRQLNLVIDSSYDGYWDWFIKTDYEYMSPRFWEILGYAPHEKKHHPSEWQKLIFPEDLEVALENFNQHIKTKGKHPFDQEVRYTHKSGKTVWISCKGKVISWSPNGEPIRMVGTHRDITDFVELRDKLEKRKIKEERFDHLSSLGEMAGGIAHEINNPLAVLSGHADILKRSAKKEILNHERVLKSADIIKDTVKRIGLIVKGLKTFTRKGGSDEKEEFSLLEVLKEIEEITKNRCSNHEINFSYDIQPQHKIYGQKVQISQVLINLINNAFDAIKHLDKRWVKILYSEDLDYQKVIITDSGKGIPKELKSKVMKPFFTTKPNDEGTGIGLSISKNIIEKHDGFLTINDKKPNTTFEILLPRVSQ